MKSIKTIVIVLFIVLVNTSFLIAATQKDSLRIVKYISKENGIDQTTIKLFKIEKEQLESDYITEAFIVTENEEEIGYAIAAQGKGRYDTFDYLIFYTKKIEIKWVRITTYYSDHGGQIASKKWLQQFEGFHGGLLNYGKEVQAISGATLSGTSITQGIAEISRLLQNSDL